MFRHGPHAGLPVSDLVDSFMSGEERPEGLTPMVAAAWRGNLYIVLHYLESETSMSSDIIRNLTIWP